MLHSTIAAWHQELVNKRISSVELLQLYLDRIEKWDPTLHAFITVNREGAFQQAKNADTRISKGDITPLTGIPIAHKDIICTKGLPTTCASKILSNFVSPYDATLVENFYQAGAVVIGKTNMDEFAMGSSNETSYFGPVRNPWDTECVPGGSSGGSAAAVSAQLCVAATGTDTGGSIRQPAALCGITGLKPTYGRVSRYGLVAFASSLDQAGPFATTAHDVALMMNVMAGFDPKDSTSLNEPVPNYTKTLDQSLEGLKIGLPSFFFGNDLDPRLSNVMQDAIAVLKSKGAQCVSVELPHCHLSIPAYYIVAPAEASSNLARYDGVRYGYRCDDPKDLEDLYLRTRTEGFGKEVKRRILIGTYVLSSGYYDAYYVKAQKVRQLIRQDFVQAFEKVDVILGPTSPTVAFRLGEKTTNPIDMYLADIFTIPANLAGLPGLSIPCGFIDQKPVGLQILGNYLSEGTLLNIAHGFQQETDWHLRRPKNFE